MTGALALSLLSAIALAITAVLSKRLTLTIPARQLIGPLLLLNALLVLPFAPFVSWQFSWHILVLHLLEVSLLVISSLAVWDLFDSGEASATVTAQALSPLPATIAVALLLPAAFIPGHAVAAAVVVAAVLAGLTDAFPQLGRRRTLATLVITAVATGLLTVTSRLLADEGVEVVPTYLIRTTLAAALAFSLHPPRDVPLYALPRLAVRAVFVTTHFLLVLLAVRAGSPAVVQTIIATAPMLVLGYEVIRRRERPSARLVASILGAALGVSIVLVW